MRNQKGMTLVELMLVVAAASLVLTAASSYAIPMIARESMRGAVYDVQTFLQLARIESIKRNRECRFTVHRPTRTITVWDGVGTSTRDDDVSLYSATLPSSVAFGRPDFGGVITTYALGTGTRETRFSSDGTVAAGTGAVHLYGGDGYRRVTVYGAGGVYVEHWGDSAWQAGS